MNIRLTNMFKSDTYFTERSSCEVDIHHVDQFGLRALKS